jgi:anti-sigma factor RsiW
MIEERHIELIHAELDGELTSKQHAELSRLLLANPEARAFRDELNRLFVSLAGVAGVEPPPDLARSVLQAVELKSAQEPRLPGRTRFLRLAWSPPTPLRYAAIFAGGLLAGTIVLQLASGGRSSPDVSQLVGTIGGHDRAVLAAPIDQIELDLDQANGSASAFEVQSTVVLQLDVSALQPVKVVATHGDHSVSFNLAARPGKAPERLLWVAGEAGSGGSPIEVRIFSSEKLLYEGVLETSRAR